MIEPPYVFVVSLLVGTFLAYFLWDIAKGLLKIFMVITVVYLCSMTDARVAQTLDTVRSTIAQAFREMVWPRLRAWGDEL